MSKERLERPDIEITADVKARELRFEEAPKTEVRFPGHPERESVSATERENLPDQVEPGVTYRNPKVRLRIATMLAEPVPRERSTENRRESRDNRARRKK